MSAMDVLLELVLRGAEKDRANNEKTGHGHLPKNQPSLFLAATAAASLKLLKKGEKKAWKRMSEPNKLVGVRTLL